MTPELTLTATEQQARALRRNYNWAQKEQGRSAWPSPAILSIGRYIRQAWLASWPEQHLLSPSQELLLWYQLISADPRGQTLLAPRQLARQLANSWRTAWNWRIDWQSGPHWSEEEQLFARLATQYSARLQALDGVTSAQLPSQFIARLNDGQIQAPALIRCHGLTDASEPAARQVCDALQRAGSRLEHLPATGLESRLEARLCPDPVSQWQTIGAEIAGALQTAPQLRIVVALPQVQAERTLIESIWRDMLAPWQLHADDPATPAPWQFEADGSLADQAAVQAACQCLRMRLRDNSFAAFAALLLDPLLFDAAARGWTAQIERGLRERGPHLPLEDILQLLPEAAPATLKARLGGYLQTVRSQPSRGSALAWLEHWRACWAAIGFQPSGPDWPLGEELEQALLEFSRLDSLLGAVPQAEALYWLQTILRNTRYSPRQTHHQAITLCEPGSAADLPCDWLILANFSGRRCPPAARPDPFLNLSAQIEAGYPAASAAGQLQHTEHLLHRLQGQSPRFSAYCCLSDEQGAADSPSPLLTLPWQTADDTVPTAASGVSATYPDSDPVPPLDPARAPALKGGTRIVQSQAYAPFFAFARHRLELKALPEPHQGLPANAQGNWIHAVLQSFWEAHRSRARLLELNDADLGEDLRRRIAATAEAHLPARRYGQELQTLESDRILRVCRDWLEHERQRLDDFTVIHCETQVEHQLDLLSMRLRIDRIDRCMTPAGPRYLIIDYKTGSSVQEKHWDVQQFYEPQLPLYACSDGLRERGVPQVDGICFGHVVERHPAFVASLNWRRWLAREDDKEFFVDWQQTLRTWRLHLDALVRDFCAGGSTIDANHDYRRDYAVADLLALVDTLEPTDDA